MVKIPLKTVKAELWDILVIARIYYVRQRTDRHVDIPIKRFLIHTLCWLILPMIQRFSGGANKKDFPVSIPLYGTDYYT